ncbi:HpcH/HpaI aldolase family protein [Alteraurantiacibacter aquimixticola]|uniref:2-dehydro-3-deoxyglucarate aldolase n=1 Tax=Alteraurantiacibacter aquimixticola TaxID=2489173 RepID=A0A4T3F3T8_9SPHN|nr:aldolase/citrate lyase family protein [Alteraurantiacibacter aquimixticola]TIX50944.1 2-dehydro-3-deoxyglucarate aldolase [Alteraurantiacibacter aquimixticola]
MQNLVERVQAEGRGLLGTWVKIPSFETVQLIGHAGFDFVVIDMEHAPHSLDRANELVFCAQAMGMAALVRMPDQLGSTIQPLLDGGADGLLVPRVTSTNVADAISRRMVFAPKGERGLGTTSRAGRWGLAPMEDYLKRGDEQVLRMIQLEDWASVERAAEFAALPHVNGLFIGHGDLFLSSGKPASDPAVRELTAAMLAATKEAGIASGVAVGSPEEARSHLEQGFSLVMLSNDTTLFGQAVAEAAAAARA